VLEIDRAAYKRSVDDVLLFLEGKKPELVERLQGRMWDAAGRLDYEVAARLRDQIAAVSKTLERQDAALPSMRDQDVIGLHREGAAACIAVLEVRGGRIAQIHSHFFAAQVADDAALLETFVLQSYENREDVPSEVLLPMPLEEGSREALSEILGERRGRRVDVMTPKRGERARVLELAQENAEHAFSERQRRDGVHEAALEGLRARLGLKRTPVRMECYDISNFQGRQIVGSQVVFEDGQPKKAAYRRYRVKTRAGQDDFGSIYEVLSRRLRRGLEKGELPDLLVIDGGKGQLGAARAAMRDLGVEGVDVIGLAKSRTLDGDDEGPSQRSPERVFLPGAKDPVVLPQTSPEVLLLARIRDEAHRFAITFQRDLGRRAQLRSGLEEIPGVGAVRRRALLTHLGSMKRIREATLEELEAVPKLGAEGARKVYAFLHGALPDASGRASATSNTPAHGGDPDGDAGP
jgi:excinuclease ABC subunit C